MINGSDTTRWPLTPVDVLAEEWRNLECMLEEVVLIAALSPSAVGGAVVRPTNLPPLSSIQEDALQNLKGAASICM